MYGSEVWGVKNTEVIEQLQLKFLRSVLKVNRSTPKCMLYGEVGRLPLRYNIEQRMVNFWYRIISGNKRKISFNIYQLLYKLDSKGILHSDWIMKIKQILTNCGIFDRFWNNQEDQALFAKVSREMFKGETMV